MILAQTSTNIDKLCAVTLCDSSVQAPRKRRPRKRRRQFESFESFLEAGLYGGLRLGSDSAVQAIDGWRAIFRQYSRGHGTASWLPRSPVSDAASARWPRHPLGPDRISGQDDVGERPGGQDARVLMGMGGTAAVACRSRRGGGHTVGPSHLSNSWAQRLREMGWFCEGGAREMRKGRGSAEGVRGGGGSGRMRPRVRTRGAGL